MKYFKKINRRKEFIYHQENTEEVEKIHRMVK